ncbi:MAG: hypothetical protein AAFZ07_21670 [Actinomycetota bacterium]
MEPQSPSDPHAAEVEEITATEVVEHHGPGRRALLVMAGVLAVAGIVGVVAIVLRRSEPVEPVDASAAFMESMADGDVLGMLEHLDQGERDALAQPTLDVVEELRRLDVLGEGLDPADLTALDLAWAEMTTQEIRRTDYLSIVDVRFTDMTVDADARQLLGGLFTTFLDDAEAQGEDLTTSELVGDVELRMALIPDGDDWRVSLTHTLAEEVRRSADQPFPGEPVYEPTGAAAPEDVLDDMIDAAAELDAAGVLGLWDPREWGPLFTYSELFADDLEAALAEARVELDRLGVEIDIDLTSEVGTDDHGTYVTVSDIEARVEIEGGVLELRIEDSCLVIDATAPDGSFQSDRLCEEDLTAQSGVDADEVLDLLPDAFRDLGDLQVEPIGLRVVEIDGRWYLSPIGSMLRAADSGLEAFEPELVSDLVDAVVELGSDPSALFELTEDLEDLAGAGGLG